ncbi:hypothetical protein D9Q98_002660 [Chlorella vulgaris]|uniref:Protein kinase domain-containing protein n=1 Tax=Chlorella vulgaris TaxID=3077 RepID=A0A9D4TTT9_CHLVU|nr:hypothetical protein D9Q98_002660 [Chlorella vulgaris]
MQHVRTFCLLTSKLLLICALAAASRRRPTAGLANEYQGRPGGPLASNRRHLLQAKQPAMALYTDAQMLAPSNGSTEGGGVLLPGRVPLGTRLVAAAGNVVPSIDKCLDACRQNHLCNAFWYCEVQGGCFSGAYNLTAPTGGCELVDQEVTRPGTGRPLLLVEAPAFTGGAPLRHAAPSLQGYEVWPGLGFWYRYDLPCANSVSQPGSCGLAGGPEQNVQVCDTDPDCQAIMWFPNGRDYPGAGQPVVLLKGSQDSLLDVANANININAVLYMKMNATSRVEGSSKGLSKGAVAGIVVGSCCCVTVVIVLAFVVRRRRRRRQSEELSTVEAKLPPLGNASLSATSNQTSGDMEPYGCLSLFGQKEQSSFRVIKSAARVQWAEASLLVGSRGGLPDGDLHSVAPESTAKSQARCPAPPPPTLGSSLATLGRPVLPRSAGSDASPPGQALLLSPGVPSLPPGLPRTPKADVGPHPLLSNLPTYGWQRCAVDYSAIQFIKGPDGEPEELGSGASATVYRVLLNGVEPHAAKVFRLGADPQAQLYFLEEASTLRLLRHTHVVGFAGVCVAGGSGIILMELMDGGDLRGRNREVDAAGRRTFSWYQRGRRVALDVALALNYLHTSSYTHFDVKSRNVLLSRDLTAKLADVGFARAIRTTHHSIEGPTGTFDYMAPELLTGRKCNSSIDVYSFGCLVWEICTGKYPGRGSMRDLVVPAECPQVVADLVERPHALPGAQMPNDPSGIKARSLCSALQRLQFVGGGAASGGGGAVAVPNDPRGIKARSLCSALQRLQFVGGGAASGGGGAVAVPNDPSGIKARSLCSALQRLQFVGGGAASGGGGAVAVPNDPSGINGRSLCSALQRFECGGGGAASGDCGAVAVPHECSAIKGAACAQRRSGLSVAVAARRAVTVGRWR